MTKLPGKHAADNVGSERAPDDVGPPCHPERSAEGAESRDRHRTRTITWTDPQTRVPGAETMTGRDYLEKWRDGTAPNPPFAELIGLNLAEVHEGSVVFTIEPEEFLSNGIGLMHGGVTATVIDSAIGCSILTLLPPGKAAVTLDLHVRYYKPITSDAGLLRCEGKMLNLGRTTAAAQAQLVDANGRVYASGTSACAIVTRGPRT